jgi:hypothetical protein
LRKSGELCLKKFKDSSVFREISGIVTGDFGIVTADFGKPGKIGHDKTKSAVTIRRVVDGANQKIFAAFRKQASLNLPHKGRVI